VVIFGSEMDDAPTFGDDPYSTKIDGVDVSANLALLAEQSAVVGLSKFEPASDKHGLAKCADTVRPQWPSLHLLVPE
jgi:hypothetical protein